MRAPTPFARESDRIANFIMHSDLEWIDIQIMIEQLRERVLAEFPDKSLLFEHLYVSRFERLWRDWHTPLRDQQWRP
jgi:hypothetical protein